MLLMFKGANWKYTGYMRYILYLRILYNPIEIVMIRVEFVRSVLIFKKSLLSSRYVVKKAVAWRLVWFRVIKFFKLFN